MKARLRVPLYFTMITLSSGDIMGSVVVQVRVSYGCHYGGGVFRGNAWCGAVCGTVTKLLPKNMLFHPFTGEGDGIMIVSKKERRYNTGVF